MFLKEFYNLEERPGCNMTEEGRNCPEHGVMECPGYKMIEGGIKGNKPSVADKMHKRHQDIRKKSGLPDPNYYKELLTTYDLPDKERFSKATKIKRKYGIDEGLLPGEYHHWEDEVDPRTGKKKRIYKGIRGEPHGPTSWGDSGAAQERHDREARAHRQYDRKLREFAPGDGSDRSMDWTQLVNYIRRTLDSFGFSFEGSQNFAEYSRGNEALTLEYDPSDPDWFGWALGRYAGDFDVLYSGTDPISLNSAEQVLEYVNQVFGYQQKDLRENTSHQPFSDFDSWRDRISDLGGEIHVQKNRTLYVATNWSGEDLGQFDTRSNQGWAVSKDINESQPAKKLPKPRNPVVRNQQITGSGAHKDKKKAQKQGDVKHKGRELDLAEATGDEKFDTMMSRIATEPKVADMHPDMPPTSIDELIQWAGPRQERRCHLIFARWAKRKGFKNVNDALMWYGDNHDPFDEWKDTDDLVIDAAKKGDPEAQEYMRLFSCYEKILDDWDVDYLHMNTPDPFRKPGGEGVAEGLDDIVKGVKRKLKGKEHPEVVASKHFGRALGHYNQGEIPKAEKEIKRFNKIQSMNKGTNALMPNQLGEQDVVEAGPFSYGAKKPKKGSVADLAAKKRKEQERGRQPVEPQDQRVGVAKILPKDVKEAKHFRTAYGWAGGRNEKTGRTYKHPEQIKADKADKKQGISKDQENKFHAKLDNLVHDTFGKRKGEMEEGLRDPKDNPCWKGYKPVGTKEKNGRTVPNCVPTNEDIERYIEELERAGYGIIEEEKVRLDPKCWKGKKIGNPKTKMKGGVRVNNCVPK